MTKPSHHQQLAPVLDWSHDVTHLPRKRSEANLVCERDATDQELADVCAALGVVSCTSMQSRYEIGARGKGRYLLLGSLRAELAQACVVSLEPVPEIVDETFEVEFWPADQLDTGAGEEVELGPDDLETRDIEPIHDNVVAAGQVIYEVLASGLAPYPRAVGAEFDPVAVGAAAPVERKNPFAVLAKVKDQE